MDRRLAITPCTIGINLLLALALACNREAGGGGDGATEAGETGGGGGTAGLPCEQDGDCESGTCVLTDPEPSGGTCAGDCPGVPASYGATCAGPDACFPGWYMWSLMIGDPPYCRCDRVNESDVCNGWDDDCDAILDEDGDAYCEGLKADFGCEAAQCVDCPERCDGLCTDVQTDLQNCRACGEACPASPPELESVCRQAGCGSMEAMSQRLGSYWFPFVDADSIYFADVEASPKVLLSCPIDGCGGDPTVVSDDLNYGNNFAQDAATIYWTAEGRLRSCAKTGCEDATILLDVESGGLDGIHLSGDYIYVTYSDGRTGAVFRCPKTGCVDAPFEIVTGTQGTHEIAGDDTTLYFDDGELWGDPDLARLSSCPIGGCQGAPAELLEGYNIERLSLHGGMLYFYGVSEPVENEGHQGAIYRCPTSGCADGLEQLAVPKHELRALRIDNGVLHWLTWDDNEHSALYSCPTDDCEAPEVVLATDLTAGGFAVTPDFYFLPQSSDDAQGKLFRAAR